MRPAPVGSSQMQRGRRGKKEGGGRRRVDEEGGEERDEWVGGRGEKGGD